MYYRAQRSKCMLDCWWGHKKRYVPSAFSITVHSWRSVDDHITLPRAFPIWVDCLFLSLCSPPADGEIDLALSSTRPCQTPVPDPWSLTKGMDLLPQWDTLLSRLSCGYRRLKDKQIIHCFYPYLFRRWDQWASRSLLPRCLRLRPIKPFLINERQASFFPERMTADNVSDI